MIRIFAFAGFLMLFGCSKNDQKQRCNFLLDLNVNATVNLNLPQYSQLQFSGNTVYIANQGNGGIYLSNIGNQFRAFDAADPSHQFSSCSLLVKDGDVGTCGCNDGNKYSLSTGLPIETNSGCTMKEYRVENAGDNVLVVYN